MGKENFVTSKESGRIIFFHERIRKKCHCSDALFLWVWGIWIGTLTLTASNFYALFEGSDNYSLFNEIHLHLGCRRLISLFIKACNSAYSEFIIFRAMSLLAFGPSAAVEFYEYINDVSEEQLYCITSQSKTSTCSPPWKHGLILLHPVS